SKRSPNRLFLLSFSEGFTVHQIALAKCPSPYYALCSAGTSTQALVDSDLQEENRAPANGDVRSGWRAEGNSQRVIRKPAGPLALRQSAHAGKNPRLAFTTTRFRQETLSCNLPALRPQGTCPGAISWQASPEARWAPQ